MGAFQDELGRTIVPTGRGEERLTIFLYSERYNLATIQIYGQRGGLKATCGVELDTLRQGLLLSGIATVEEAG